jgi:transposase
MINQDKIFRIHVLKNSGISERNISKRLKVSRSTVARYLKEPIQKDRKNNDKMLYDLLIHSNFQKTYKIIKKYLINNKKELTSISAYFHFPEISGGYKSKTQNKIDIIWLLKILQGRITLKELSQYYSNKISLESLGKLYDAILNKPRRYRNRAITVLLYLKNFSQREIARKLYLSRSSVARYISKYKIGGVENLLDFSRIEIKKYEDPKYSDAIFSMLHSPPSSYGFNRTTWRMSDLHKILIDKGLGICLHNIRKIIKDSGYKFYKARKALTSNDPDYREKLEKITQTLSELKYNEKFFSVDEFGPFAIKKQGGKELREKGDPRIIPQFQKSKGSLIITGALELSTNQMTHFYSAKKNTLEMLKLIDVLLKKYNDEECIYFSWDAASWHASKELYKKVDQLNNKKHHKPKIGLLPLPISAQFLNVIESIYSGMARAIIHNSDYQSVNECKKAIDRYFLERNEHFKEYPKRAGNKIWGKERVKPIFSESNNCKDPRYMRN